jgi:transposase InsO family protein
LSRPGSCQSLQKLKEFDHLPVEERVALYYKLKKESPDTYNFKNEDELTMYGYSFLWNNNLPDALAIFKLIVAEFPHSSNPYDSLGEAYMKNGEYGTCLDQLRKVLGPESRQFQRGRPD